ncbi:hypothetical protein [Blastococcus sp. SYSU D00813]
MTWWQIAAGLGSGLLFFVAVVAMASVRRDLNELRADLDQHREDVGDVRGDMVDLGEWAEKAQEWMTDADRHLPGRDEPTMPQGTVVEADLQRVLEETPRPSPTPRPRGRHAAPDS